MAQITGYVAARPVLNIRESPGTQSKVVGKIPYEKKSLICMMSLSRALTQTALMDNG